MKKIIIIITMVLVVTLTAGCTNNRPKAPGDDSKAEGNVSASATDPETSPVMPFKDLNMFEIDHITVEFGIHNYRLNDEQRGKFVNKLLKEIVIYGEATKTLDGGSVTFKIAYKGNLGKEVKVDLCDTQIYIDGKGYECDRETCRAAADYIYDIYLYQFHN